MKALSGPVYSRFSREQITSFFLLGEKDQIGPVPGPPRGAFVRDEILPAENGDFQSFDLDR